MEKRGYFRELGVLLGRPAQMFKGKARQNISFGTPYWTPRSATIRLISGKEPIVACHDMISALCVTLKSYSKRYSLSRGTCFGSLNFCNFAIELLHQIAQDGKDKFPYRRLGYRNMFCSFVGGSANVPLCCLQRVQAQYNLVSGDISILGLSNIKASFLGAAHGFH